MNTVDDLPGRLRAQMREATATDMAPPDLLDRVHRSVARRRHRQVGALAASAVGAAVVVVALPPQGGPPEPARLAAPSSPTVELSVVRADAGRLSVSVQVDGQVRTERVELPGFVRNAGEEPVTVVGMTVVGTGLEADFPRQVLAPGGERPLTLVRVVDCDAAAALPAELVLRVSSVSAGSETSVLLALPEEVVALYRQGHACTPELRSADDAEAATRGD